MVSEFLVKFVRGDEELKIDNFEFNVSGSGVTSGAGCISRKYFGSITHHQSLCN